MSGSGWTSRQRSRAPLATGAFAILLLVLLWGARGVEAHPGMPAVLAVPIGVDAVPIVAAPIVPSRPEPTLPLAAAPATAGAWTWGLLVALPGIAAVRLRRGRHGLALGLVILLGIFAGEAAIHSAHHLNDPQKAERCPVYSASLHVTGLEAVVATPEPPRPVPTHGGLRARDVRLLTRTLDGQHSRAPPARPA